MWDFKSKNPNDPAHFISMETATKDGKDENKINKETMYDGLYSVYRPVR